MAILIQKNGGFISFLEGGFVRATLKEDCTMNLSNKRQGIEFIDSDARSHFLYAPAVTETQLAPAAAVPFSGDIVQLWQLLTTSFFNELHAGALPAIDSDDVANVSSVAGANITQALDNLNAKYIFPKLEMSGLWNISGIISPPAMATNENDYSPVGFADNTVLRLAASASRTNLTGFAAPSGGEQPIKIIHNVGSGRIRLIANSVASLSANRLIISSNININALETGIIWYDSAAAGWKLFAIT